MPLNLFIEHSPNCHCCLGHSCIFISYLNFVCVSWCFSLESRDVSGAPLLDRMWPAMGLMMVTLLNFGFTSGSLSDSGVQNEIEFMY